MNKPLQIMIFEEIKKKIPKEQKFVNEIADFLNLSKASVYKINSGKTSIDGESLLRLMIKYDICINKLNKEAGKNVSFEKFSRNLGESIEYIQSLEDLHTRLMDFETSKSTKWMIASDDVPLFHVINFPELTFLYMYKRYRDNGVGSKSYEEFLKTLPIAEMRDTHRKLFLLFKSVHSVEIISQSGILSFRDTIIEVKEEGAFDNKESVEKIQHAFLLMIEQIKQWCTEGTKDGGGKFNLYYSALGTNFNSLLSTQHGQPEFTMIESVGQDVLITEDKSTTAMGIKKFETLRTRKMCMCGLGESNRNKKMNYLKAEISTITQNYHI